MAKNFKEGEKVLAKWPGSRRYEEATIVSISEGKQGEKYKVQYKDKTSTVISFEELRTKSPPKSPKKKAASPKKAARGRSASKSPGRSPANTPKKSPGRSPARTPKERSVSRGRKGAARTPSQSPSRTKGAARTPSQSPSRTKKASKSPSRGRSRSKSPTKPKPKASPARSRSRSPSKTKQKPKPKAPKTPPRTPSPKRRGRPKKDEALFSSPDSSPSPVKKKTGKAIKSQTTPASPSRKKRQTKEQLAEFISAKAELVPFLAKMKEKEVEEVEVKEQVDSVSRKVYSTRSKLAAKTLEVTPLPTKTSSLKLKAGLFGILFSVLGTALLPILTLYLALNCVRKNYSLLTLPQIPKASAFFNLKVAGVYMGFILLQAVLSALPIGRIVKGFHSQHDKSPLLYRLNGIYSLLATVGLLGVLGYLGQPIQFVIDNFFKLTCTATAFSFVVSVALYIRALLRPRPQINQFADTGCTPYDFHHGHELHPRLGSLYDLKLLTIRTGLVGWAVVVISLTYKCYLLNSCVHYELGLAAGAQLLYIVDMLYREEALLATATVMYEGLGFGLSHAAHAMAPFTFSIPVYILVNVKPNMPLYCLAGMAAIFLFSLVMNRKSLSSKTLLKRNPDSKDFIGPQKTVTVSRVKLLSSGWWGLVRHPNYISEILMFVAWTLPCGVHMSLPYLPALVIFLSLLRRCFQVEAIMSRSYPEAYQQYKHRVPYRLCPYVF